MKIAFLAFGFIPNMGGAQIFTYNIIKLLSERGHDVTLYLPYSVYKKYKKTGMDDQFAVLPLFLLENLFLQYLSSYLLPINYFHNFWKFGFNYRFSFLQMGYSTEFF